MDPDKVPTLVDVILECSLTVGIKDCMQSVMSTAAVMMRVQDRRDWYQSGNILTFASIHQEHKEIISSEFIVCKPGCIFCVVELNIVGRALCFESFNCRRNGVVTEVCCGRVDECGCSSIVLG